MSDFMEKCKTIVFLASIMKTEFVTCFEVNVQANWLQNFISGLGVVNNIVKPLRIYCDNYAVLLFFLEYKVFQSVKHMKFKYSVVKKKV